MCPVEFQNLYEPVPAVCVYAFLHFSNRSSFCGYPIPASTLDVRYASLVTSLQLKHHMYRDLI